MFPPLRHRVLIALAATLGGLIWLLAGGVLRAPDGGSGYSLVTAQAGLVVASLVVALLGVPVLVLGLGISAVGHPLSGIFTTAAALCFLAGRGGAIDGWLWRSAEHNGLPTAYGALIGEMLLWQIGVMIMITIVGFLRSPMRARWPALAYDDHLGVDTHIRLPQMQSIVAGVACGVIAALAAIILIRSSDAGQVMWSLIAAFTIGGCAAHLAFPHSNPVGILLSPALVAVLAYAWMMIDGQYSTTRDVLEFWHSVRFGTALPGGLALALPIHYASAGVLGCTLGVGLAHALESSRHRDVPAQDARGQG